MSLLFPIIKEEQVVLLRVDSMTGHVLDEFFLLHKRSNQNQNAYTVFETLSEAKKYIQDIISIHPKVEFIIYSSEQDVIFTVPCK